jgi:hypothetical protein
VLDAHDTDAVAPARTNQRPQGPSMLSRPPEGGAADAPPPCAVYSLQTISSTLSLHSVLRERRYCPPELPLPRPREAPVAQEDPWSFAGSVLEDRRPQQEGTQTSVAAGRLDAIQRVGLAESRPVVAVEGHECETHQGHDEAPRHVVVVRDGPHHLREHGTTHDGHDDE